MTYRYRPPVDTISFPEKPSAAVLDALKAFGFRWNRQLKAWGRPRSISTATIIDAIRGGETDIERIAERCAERQAEADCGII